MIHLQRKQPCGVVDVREQGIISRNTWYTVYLGPKKYNMDKSPPPLTRKRQPTVRCSRHSFSADALPRARVYSVQPHFGCEQVPCTHTPTPTPSLWLHSASPPFMQHKSMGGVFGGYGHGYSVETSFFVASKDQGLAASTPTEAVLVKMLVF